MRTPLTAEEIDALVTATAAALGLDIAPGMRPGVCRYFALAADMAVLVEGLPLARDDDPAGLFMPVSPA